MADCVPSTSKATTSAMITASSSKITSEADSILNQDGATMANRASKSVRHRPAMTDYADAIESLEEELASDGLRRRVPWDSLSLGSDVPGLHEVKVSDDFHINTLNFRMYSFIECAYLVFSGTS